MNKHVAAITNLNTPLGDLETGTIWAFTVAQHTIELDPSADKQSWSDLDALGRDIVRASAKMIIIAHSSLNPESDKYTAGRTAESLHDFWLNEKLNEGWVCGPAIDREKKEDPCMKPWHELSSGHRLRDITFHNLVLSVLNWFVERYNAGDELSPSIVALLTLGEM